MLTQLEKYVITYEDVSGGIVCNIPAYYNIRVVPLGEKFEAFDFDNNRTVICPLHDDHDPSLGLMKDRNLPKVMLYHCLGCGSVGNVVRLHQRIESEYHGRDISVKEACLELCEIFGIPEPDDSVFDEEDYERRYQYRMNKIDKLKGAYTEKSYKDELLAIRKSGNIDLDRVNLASIKMISTQKGLYRL